MKNLVYLCAATFGVVLPVTSRAQASRAQRLPFEYLSLGSIRIQAIVDTPRVGSTLHNVQQDLGPAEIRDRRYKPDEFASFRFICYRGDSAHNPFLMLLVSDDEMGGEDSKVQEITVALPTAAPPYATSCSPLRDSTRSAVTDRGIRLGMRRRVVERILGAPTERHGSKAVYDVTVKRPNKRHPDSCQPVDASSSLELIYEKELLVSLKGSRDDQC